MARILFGQRGISPEGAPDTETIVLYYCSRKYKFCMIAARNMPVQVVRVFTIVRYMYYAAAPKFDSLNHGPRRAARGVRFGLSAARRAPGESYGSADC